MKRKTRVILPTDSSSQPADHEISAAYILKDYFKTDVVFIDRQRHKTPDVEIKNIRWEIKSPTGGGKRNIQHQILNARKQSNNIVLDARRAKMRSERIMSELNRWYSLSPWLKRLILITKSGKVIEFKR